MLLYIVFAHNQAKVFDFQQRLTSGDLVQGNLIKENESNLQMCKKYGLNCILIDTEYKVDIEL